MGARGASVGALALWATWATACARPYVPCSVAEPKAEREYLLAELRIGAVTRDDKQAPEVSETPAYFKARDSGALKTAAIRLPSSCQNETAGEVTGSDTRGDTVIQTNCGVWLKEIERALSAQNFRVISWDSIAGTASAKGMAAYEAAHSLNADVLFLFNSLETTDVGIRNVTEETLGFFESDHEGHRGAPKPLTESEARGLKADVEMRGGNMGIGKENASDAIGAFSATLDATAVLTTTGEAAWFYRHSVSENIDVETSKGAAFLYARNDQGKWQITKPDAPVAVVQAPVAAPVVEKKVTGFASSTQSTTTRQDPYKAKRLAFIRRVAADFVERFRTGPEGGGGVKAAAATPRPAAPPAPAARPVPAPAPAAAPAAAPAPAPAAPPSPAPAPNPAPAPAAGEGSQ